MNWIRFRYVKPKSIEGASLLLIAIPLRDSFTITDLNCWKQEENVLKGYCGEGKSYEFDFQRDADYWILPIFNPGDPRTVDTSQIVLDELVVKSEKITTEVFTRPPETLIGTDRNILH